MSYANMFEVTKCLEDSLRYCREHPEREHCVAFENRLAATYEEFNSAVDISDNRFIEWRMDDRDGRLAWKHLARELALIQGRLGKVNAIGYIDQKVMYWDTPILVAAVDEMISYLEERQDDLDFAAEKIDKLKRQKAVALSDSEESDAALKDYIRFSQIRSDAMTNAVNTIASFRRVLRRDLGRESEEYHSILWPQAVASDEAVL